MKSIPVTCPHCQVLQSYIEGERSPCCYYCGATLLPWKESHEQRREAETEARTGAELCADAGPGATDSGENPTGAAAIGPANDTPAGRGTRAAEGAGVVEAVSLWRPAHEFYTPPEADLRWVSSVFDRWPVFEPKHLNIGIGYTEGPPMRLHEVSVSRFKAPKFRGRARRLRAVGFDILRQMFLLAGGGHIGAETIRVRESYPDRKPRREFRRARKRRQK